SPGPPQSRGDRANAVPFELPRPGHRASRPQVHGMLRKVQQNAESAKNVLSEAGMRPWNGCNGVVDACVPQANPAQRQAIDDDLLCRYPALERDDVGRSIDR